MRNRGKRQSLFQIMGFAALVLFVASSVPAAAKGVEIGEKMPDFYMKDLAGDFQRLSDFKDKIVVLEFTSFKCPWSRGADPQLIKTYEKYGPKGVIFLGIDSHKDTPPKEILEYNEKINKLYPILKDEKNKYADLVNAQRTPEIYIVHKNGALVYHGAFDNRTKPDEKGDTNYVGKALDALLAGEKIAEPKTAAWGCTIKRVDKE
jgi:thiol-disulfide isomerase/thioredoxin